MSTVEVLKAAWARIATGWIQGLAYREEPEGWCAAGALTGFHLGRSSLTCGACDAENALLKVIGSDDIPTWNDAPGRTQAEVLEAFDKAIALAEAATSRDAAGERNNG